MRGWEDSLEERMESQGVGTVLHGQTGGKVRKEGISVGSRKTLPFSEELSSLGVRVELILEVILSFVF